MKNLFIRLLAQIGLQPIPRVRHIVLPEGWEPSDEDLKAISELFRA